VDRRAHVAGIDRGDRDRPAVFQPQGVRPRGERALGRHVGGGEREVGDREAAGHVHHPAAGLEQRGQRGGRHPPSSEQVDVEHGLRALVGRRAGVVGVADAGVVDQHVEAAEPVDRLAHGRGDLLAVADVGHEHVRATVAVDAEHARPARPQQLGGGRADAPARAGDQDAQPGQVAGRAATCSVALHAATRSGAAAGRPASS
jgi:hypothetical protein